MEGSRDGEDVQARSWPAWRARRSRWRRSSRPSPRRPGRPRLRRTRSRRRSDTVVITGIGYRDRTDDTAPVLVYGTDYIQPFEPLTVGDALKRVPSVTFLSDVLESDGVRLRGLDPAYTQILINGEKVPGAGSDFWRVRQRRRWLVLCRSHPGGTDRQHRDRALQLGQPVGRCGRGRGEHRAARRLQPRWRVCAGGGCAVRRWPRARNPWRRVGRGSGRRAHCCSAPTCRAAATRRKNSRCAMTSRARRSTITKCRPTRATAPTIRSTAATRSIWAAANSISAPSLSIPSGRRTRTASSIPATW